MTYKYKILNRVDTEQERRSDYDVTNTVRVSSTTSVRRAIEELFDAVYPRLSFDSLWLAFHDFERMFTGKDPDYHGVDTAYHDIQHTLDMTLAMARLMAGYDSSVDRRDRFGADRVKFGIVAALFHDSGYLRHKLKDQDAVNGAQFTLSHVTRSGRFLEAYLPRIGLEQFVDVAARVVHFTGYEMKLDDIELEDPKDSVIGHLLGTADLIAQMADRCYLEKCRDRLYPEFVVGNVAIQSADTGTQATYYSGRDLLAKTMSFYQNSAEHRLERSFNRVYRYIEPLFENGENPYIAFIAKNLAFLTKIQQHQEWQKLRRHPPCVMPDPNGEARLMTLALKRLREVSEAEIENSRRLRVLDPEAYAATLLSPT